MTKDKNEDLIILKKSSLKKFVGKTFALLIKAYIALNKETTMFWRRLFSSHSRMRKLLESDAIVLFFNTVVFGLIGRLFEGLISQILFILVFLNIAAFLIITMGWVKKLLKSK